MILPKLEQALAMAEQERQAKEQERQAKEKVELKLFKAIMSLYNKGLSINEIADNLDLPIDDVQRIIGK